VSTQAPLSPGRDRETLDRIEADPGARILFRGAAVLSMDAEVGDFAPGEVLVEGAEIVAVGADLGAAADGQAVVVDAAGCVLVPGFVDTHRHCWQTQFRRLLPNADLGRYLELMHATLAPVYELDDMYVGNHLAALGALDSGVTCVLDFSHNMRSFESADTVIRAWEDAGARAVVASCVPLFGQRDPAWRENLARIQGDRLSADGLVTLRLGAAPPVVPVVTGDLLLSPEAIVYARELGIEITADAVFGEAASAHIKSLYEQGLLGPDMTWIHCTNIDDEAWRALADSGCKVALAVTSDQQLGCEDGLPPIQKAIDHGVDYGLSVDVECCLATDMFSQMQAALNTQRMMAAQRAFGGEADGPAPIAVREMLEVATAGGAKANGVWDRCGSLTPGKQADLLLLDAEAVNNWPLNNAAASVVLGADTRNVDSVFVAGRPRKWAGSLLVDDPAGLRRRATESRDRLLERIDFDLDLLA